MASSRKPGNGKRSDYLQLGLILVVALVHGLIYVLLIPAWQHYDEPNHFEFVGLVAKLDRFPVDGDHDQDLSYSVLESMLYTGFFDDMVEKPLLESPEQPVDIPGYSQFTEPPLYYFLASIPIRWMPASPIEYQLAAARLVSLVFFIVTVVAAWGTGREFTQPGNSLRWMLPLTLVLIPGFVDTMTAVNNDVAAVVLFSLFFWGSVRMLQRGFSLSGLIWITICAVLSLYVKNTAVLAVALWPLVLVFTFVRGKGRVWAAALVVILIMSGLVSSLVWGDAAYWHRETAQTGYTRKLDDHAVVGDYVLRLEIPAQVNPSWGDALVQLLPLDVAGELDSKTVTLAGWMWASQPLSINTPALITPGASFSEQIELTTTPTFFAYQFGVPEGTERVWVSLLERMPKGVQAELYYDGLVLAEGEWPITKEPLFSSINGAQGEWGDRQFENLLRNGSAEAGWPRVRAKLDFLGAKIAPNNTTPSSLVTSILDWPASHALYSLSAQRLLTTYWAWFGWGHIPLVGGIPTAYWVLAVVTFLGFCGAVAGFFRRRKSISWDVFTLICFTLLIAWMAGLTRGVPYLSIPHYYLPVARHVYPVVIPTVTVFVFGWLDIFHWIAVVISKPDLGRDNTPDISRYMDVMRVLKGLYVFFFVFLDVWAIASIVRYYEMIGS